MAVVPVMVRCWTCKTDVPEHECRHMVGIGWSCQDKKACRERRKPCPHCSGRGTITSENIIGDPIWEHCPSCQPPVSRDDQARQLGYRDAADADEQHRRAMAVIGEAKLTPKMMTSLAEDETDFTPTDEQLRDAALARNEPCPCHKCGESWPQVSTINDGDDGMGPPVCVGCYDPNWKDPAPPTEPDLSQDAPEGHDGECSMCGLPVLEAQGLLEAKRKAMTKGPLHVPEGITEADITPEDHAIVQDFYQDACHAEWCEFDQEMLLYAVVRSRLNGQRSVK